MALPFLLGRVACFSYPAALLEVTDMARMKGVEPHEAGWFIRLVYWVVKRKVKALTGQSRILEPIKITAHHPRLLKALGQMEGGQAAAKSVPASLKSLASLKAATLVGCPF
jgi:4-carboxymuconolactone decarboxylase